MTDDQQGWMFPLNMRKAHYFRKGQIISVCGGVMVLSQHNREDRNDDSPDNCARCKKKLRTLMHQGEVKRDG